MERGNAMGDLSPLLDALTAAIQREDTNAERLDAKTRQLLALVGALFAVVQAIAFASYRQGKLGGGDRLTIAILAFAAMVLLASAALASFRQQSALKVDDLDLIRMSEFIERRETTDILAELCKDHLTALWSRRNANLERTNRYQLTFLFASPAIVVIAAELIVAIAVRLS
jgi:hypothetical protein